MPHRNLRDYCTKVLCLGSCALGPHRDDCCSDESPVMRVILLDNYHCSKRTRINMVVVIPCTYFAESERVVRARYALVECDSCRVRAMLLKCSVIINGVRRGFGRRDPHLFLATCAPRHGTALFYCHRRRRELRARS